MGNKNWEYMKAQGNRENWGKRGKGKIRKLGEINEAILGIYGGGGRNGYRENKGNWNYMEIREIRKQAEAEVVPSSSLVKIRVIS